MARLGGPRAKDAAKAKPENTGDPLVRGRLADAGAVLSGVLYFVAFAGFDQWWLTFVCLVPLYVSLYGQTTKRCVWLCFLTGLAMNLGGFYWLLNMLKVFSGFPTYLCLVFVVIICAYQALRLAFMGWLFGRAHAARLAGAARLRELVRGERARVPAPLPLVLRGDGAQRARAHADRGARRSDPRRARARRREHGRRRAAARASRRRSARARSRGRRARIAARRSARSASTVRSTAVSSASACSPSSARRSSAPCASRW